MEFAIGTLLPIVTLGALGAVVPLMLAPRFPDTLPGLARALALSAAILVLAGGGLFILLYRDAGVPLSGLAGAPIATLSHFIGLGLKAALAWLPVLALTGLAMAQGVEARRGQRLAARDAGDPRERD